MGDIDHFISLVDGLLKAALALDFDVRDLGLRATNLLPQVQISVDAVVVWVQIGTDDAGVGAVLREVLDDAPCYP